MNPWQKQLHFNPIPPLLQADDEALRFFVRRDILEEDVGPVDRLWSLPQAAKLINKQQPDGSWTYPGAKPSVRSQENYDQIETYRNVGILVEKYGLTRQHPAIAKAADFLFSFQTEDGDIRGIYGNQYSPNYSAAIMELLIKAGYEKDPRIEKGFAWLLSMRQSDGGWAIPLRTATDAKGMTLTDLLNLPEPLPPDRLKPFSHLATGVVLRAFAAHPDYRKTAEAKHAGELLASRFFLSDRYTDRNTPAFWTKIRYPFWFTDIVSALDSVSQLGLTKEDPQVKKAIEWLVANQRENGLWKAVQVVKFNGDYWVTLVICRILKRLYDSA